MTSRAAAEWIDATVPVRAGMLHWPGNFGVAFHPVLRLGAGDTADVSRVELGSHTGTHIDAPRHFLAGSAGVEAFPLELAYGPARVLDVPDDVVTADALAQHDVERGERILLRTRNSATEWATQPFRPEFVGLDESAAAHLAERQVALVGIDALSIAAPHAPSAPVHVRLFQASIWILEGLRLNDVPPGPCTLLCAPLPLVGLDGSPARVLVRPGSSASV